MGEEVALTWDPQDEKLFAEVVRSNPASFTKNFWDILPLAFPDKCKREFVSYYFNVYMLRKRASQNRSDPLYINSDDDEWEAIEERVESEAELEMDNEFSPLFMTVKPLMEHMLIQLQKELPLVLSTLTNSPINF